MKPMVFKIRTEHHAQRCELCHQSDQFDPETGFCARCVTTQVDGYKPPFTLQEFQIIQRYRNMQKRLHYGEFVLGLITLGIYCLGTYYLHIPAFYPVIVLLGVFCLLVIGGILVAALCDTCPNCHDRMSAYNKNPENPKQYHCINCGIRLS